MSDKSGASKTIAAIVGVLLLVGGFFMKADLKGMVCGTEAQPSPSPSAISQGK